MPATAREYHYAVDREGRIFHDGTEVVDPQVLRFFLRAMTREGDRYLVLCQGERNWFEPHDTPFVVQRLAVTLDQGALASVELCFQGDHREPLDPGSLEADGDALFCRVRGGRFRARFGRVAIQQIAPFLLEVGGEPTLLTQGARHAIPAAHPVAGGDDGAPDRGSRPAG